MFDWMFQEDAKWDTRETVETTATHVSMDTHITMDTKIHTDVYHTFAETMTTHKHAPQIKQVKSFHSACYLEVVAALCPQLG